MDNRAWKRWVGVIALAWAVSCATGQGTVPRDDATVEGLIKQLGDKDGKTRYKAAERLGAMGPLAVAAVPALIARFDDWEEVPSEDRASQGPFMHPATVALEACGKMGAGAVPELAKALRSENKRVRIGATQSLVILGEPGLETLIQGYREGRVEAFIMASSPYPLTPKALEPLLALLKDGDAKMRLKGCEAFDSYRRVEAVAPLIERLGDENEDVRTKATRALYSQGKEAIEPLIAALKNADVRRRQGAATALGRLEAKEAAAALEELVRDDAAVRQFAMEALSKIGATGVAGLAAAIRTGSPADCLFAAERLGLIKEKAAGEALLTALDSPDVELQIMVVRGLGRLGAEVMPGAGKELVPLLGTPSGALRYETAQALGQLREKTAFEALIQVMFTGEVTPPGGGRAEFLAQPIRRGRSGEILPDLKDPKVQGTRPFDRAAYEKDVAARETLNQARCAAAAALGLIGDPRAFEPLKTGLEKGDKAMRAACAAGFGGMHDVRATALLVPLLKEHDARLEYATVEALGQTGDLAAAGPLIAYIRERDKDPNASTGNAVLALQALGPGVVPLVLNVARAEKAKTVRLQMLAALPKGQKQAVPVLMELLDDGDEEIRRRVMEALQYSSGTNCGESVERWKEWWRANRGN